MLRVRERNESLTPVVPDAPAPGPEDGVQGSAQHRARVGIRVGPTDRVQTRRRLRPPARGVVTQRTLVFEQLPQPLVHLAGFVLANRAREADESLPMKRLELLGVEHGVHLGQRAA